MGIYNTILVPLDGSDLAECSLEHVKAVALGCQASSVVLLSVVEPVGFTTVDPLTEDYAVKVEVKVTETLTEYLNRIAGNLKKSGLNVKTVIANGSPAGVILDYARNENVDLIVLSSHGRSGVARWATGSVADRVANNSNVPVLLIAPKSCRI
jgi:nucleotide-binding universal stress UspA family protein